MLLDANGRLLASSDPDDAGRVGQVLNHVGLNQTRSGQTFVQTTSSRTIGTRIVDVLVPAIGSDGQVIGVVRMSYPLQIGIYDPSQVLRYLILGILVAGLILGVITGIVLALDLSRPLHQITEAVRQTATGQLSDVLPEQGPEEMRSLQHSFNFLTTRLRTLEEARRQLLANLVHEIGRPLGALVAAVQALSGGADEDPALRRELEHGMETQLHGLQHLLDDLARLHDQVLGTLELNRKEIPLYEYLANFLVPWRQVAVQNGLAWDSTVPADLPVVAADPDRLAQAMGNLVSNAIKYTPPRGRITVAAGADADEIWIRVSDTGPGITPDDLQHIFTPFYRGPAGRRFPQGMGLGLGIARDLIAAHGGRLTVESVVGQGSHFTIWLPRRLS